MASKPNPLSRSISQKALFPSNPEVKTSKEPGAQPAKQPSFIARVRRTASTGTFNTHATKKAIHSDSGNDLKNSLYEARCRTNQLAVLNYAQRNRNALGKLSIDLDSMLNNEQYKKLLHNEGQEMTDDHISSFIQTLIGDTQSR